ERIAIFAQPFKVVRQGKQAFGFHRSTSMLRVNHKPETKARFLRVSSLHERPELCCELIGCSEVWMFDTGLQDTGWRRRELTERRTALKRVAILATRWLREA
ncbi:MAG: hypothetical protein NXH88_16040, partial [Hyphomonas sp.]|nr:hypothetical protein [Hyphomonas sp.]